MRLIPLRFWAFGGIAVVAFAISGCGQGTPAENDSAQVAQSSSEVEHKEGEADEHDHEGEPIHGGWWCYEHAVPEEQCAMCDSDLAAKLREKGDWCDEHKRPDSLCFECHPENAKKFVALYEAKYGKKPPEPTD